MTSSRGDRRILAEIERHLDQDDPELDSLIDTFNRQFTHRPGKDPKNVGKVPDWLVVAALGLAIIAVFGILIAGIFGTPSRPDDSPQPPKSPTGVALQHPAPGSSR
ncbi:DUF3040 domain-containing protein [Streptomyces wuyuanensis]|uniref:DUF3040 domain-containing protein n=1 Tax=Streptomyces wuyuanensis TaxID=1196353 RepID=UPI00371DF9A5